MNVQVQPPISSLLISGAAQVVRVGKQGERIKRGPALAEVSVITDGAVLIEQGVIRWAGPSSQIPELRPDVAIIDAAGKVVLPGLVDSHTHLIFAGWRVEEFEQRLAGMSYQEIAERGGGINSSVSRVRSASKQELKTVARARLDSLLKHGVTTVEVKTGYGLSLPDEIKCLEVIAELNAEGPLELVPTFLGAHAVPPEYADRRDRYVQVLLDEMLPEVARSRLAEFCDVFCDRGAFTLDESETILRRAQQLGLQLKIHADEFTSLGGAELAARQGAVSADHLLCIRDRGIDALAASTTVATLLPGTAFFLGVDYAPARKLIDRGVAVALGSDCNPGTSPTENLPLLGTMACTQMKMLPAEVVSALTLNAAAAVGRSDRIGSIETGKQADLVIFDVPDYREIFYHFGVNHVWRVIKRGRMVFAA